MKWGWLSFGAALILALAVFGFTVHTGLLSDDYDVVRVLGTTNPWQTIATEPLGGNVFRPLPFAMLAGEMSFDTTGTLSHLVNVLIHAITAWLVGWLAWRFVPRRLPAITAGLLFLLYPAHLEPVVWISARFDLLMTLFSLCAVHCALAVRQRRDGWWWSMLVAVFLAFCSKESALTLPIILLVIPWFMQCDWRLALSHSWALIIPAVIFFWWRARVVGSWLGGYEVFGVSITQALGWSDIVHWLQSPFFLLTRWLNLSLLATRWPELAHVLDTGWLVVCILVILSVFAYLAAPRIRKIFLLCFGLAWLAFLPVLPLLHTVSRSLEGTRFWYWPSVWVVVGVSLVLGVGRGKWLRLALVSALAVAWWGGLSFNARPWQLAAAERKQIESALPRLIEELPSPAFVAFANLPDNRFGAYVFRRGFGELLDSQYPGKIPDRVQISRAPKTPFESCVGVQAVLPRTVRATWDRASAQFIVDRPQTASSGDALILPKFPQDWVVNRAEVTFDADGYNINPKTAPVSLTLPVPQLHSADLPAIALDATLSAGRNPLPISLYWADSDGRYDEFQQHLSFPVPADGQRHLTLLPLCQHLAWALAQNVTALRLQFPRDLEALTVFTISTSPHD